MTIGGCRAPLGSFPQGLPSEAMAFLGALAIGESDPEVTGSDEAYSVLFGYAHFIMTGPVVSIVKKGDPWPAGANPVNRWPATFPQWPGVWVAIGGGHYAPTHAAGRYQFEPRTWAGQQQKLKLPDFGPVSQDLAAWDLARSVYGLKLQPRSLLVDLQVGNLDSVATALHSTWTSLSSDTFADRYNQCLSGISSC